MTELGEMTSDGQTPLDADHLADLIPSGILSRADLNEAELRNVHAAVAWLHRQRGLTTADVLDDLWLRNLHRQMFGKVWRWAGRYRQRETNIGTAPEQVAPMVRQLVGDVRAWCHAGSMPPEAIAVRFHHRLVLIHPFPNGNGRHARMAADALLRTQGLPSLTWGAQAGWDTSTLRQRYLTALRQADVGDFAALEAFARA